MLIFLLILIILSALLVILSKNIIQSILYLILVFLLCSVLFIYVGADFIGLIILIVYIGAISVLFLFVVMMLNIRVLEVYSTFTVYLPLSFFLSIIFLIQIYLLYNSLFNIFEFNSILNSINWMSFINIKIILIGQLLFNEYYILFIAATLLLFIAMVGVIILTLDKTKTGNKLNYSLKLNNINWKYFR
jgi:NADH-quinone oxidoreductase subunit J